MKDLYRVYYIDTKGKEPVKKYIDKLSEKEQTKVFSYLNLSKLFIETKKAWLN